jgi:hypothetical protein
MLKIAEECFRQALDLEGTKHAEPWIYRMMLGKITSKLGRPIIEIIQHFSKVSLCEVFEADEGKHTSYVILLTGVVCITDTFISLLNGDLCLYIQHQ